MKTIKDVYCVVLIGSPEKEHALLPTSSPQVHLIWSGKRSAALAVAAPRCTDPSPSDPRRNAQGPSMLTTSMGGGRVGERGGKHPNHKVGSEERDKGQMDVRTEEEEEEEEE
ncbi:unnamed protein product [Arctogadus glacialis]